VLLQAKQSFISEDFYKSIGFDVKNLRDEAWMLCQEIYKEQADRENKKHSRS
jgi:hypothetical protein